jgi:Skp family chaperone for outer membrane proteins
MNRPSWIVIAARLDQRDGVEARAMPAGQTKKVRRPDMMMVLVLLGLALLILATGNLGRLVELFYNRTAALIAVIVLVEYVILKGLDRSAQYRRQLESSQTKRRQDLLALQKIERELEQLVVELREEAEKKKQADWAESLREKIQRLLQELRSRA